MSQPIKITFGAATADVDAALDDMVDGLGEVADASRRLTDDEVRSTDDYKRLVMERGSAVAEEYDARSRAARESMGLLTTYELSLTEEGKALAAERTEAIERAHAEALAAARDSLDAQTTAAEGATRDMADSVDDYAEAARDAHERAADSAEDSADRATAATRDMASDVEGAVDGIGDVIRDGFEDGAAGAGEALVDLIERLPGIGVAGLAVGAIIRGVFQGMRDDAAAVEERVRSMTEALMESETGDIAESYIQKQLRDIYTEADGAIISLKDLAVAAEQTGITEAQWARALSGDQRERLSILDQLRTAYAQTEVDIVSMDQATVDAATKAQAEVGRWIERLESLGGEYVSARDAADAYAEAIQLGQERATAATEGTVAEYERLNEALASQPTPVPIVPTIDLSEAEEQLRGWRPQVTITPRLGDRVV